MKLLFISVMFLVHEAIATCTHNNPCNSPRDTIIHADADVPILEKIRSNVRTWTIEPQHSVGNILLAFKRFHTSEVAIVEVRAYKFDETVETLVFSGNRGNFEMIMMNTWRVTVNVTLGIENTNFTLQYIADCDILTGQPIQNQAEPEDEALRKCVIIIPNIQGYINRIYMTLRRVNLPSGLQLKVQDVHTSEVVANLEDEQYFESIAIQSTVTIGGINSFFILIDFKCAGENCDYSAKEYIISYYAMREKDIWCIEVTKLCSSSRAGIPNNWCDIQCPALTLMAEQEYMLERISSSEISRVTGIRDFRKSTKRRVRDCPFYDRSRCQCNRNQTFDLDFCPRNVRCMLQGNCTWRCIVTKITRCIQIKLLEAIKLF